MHHRSLTPPQWVKENKAAGKRPRRGHKRQASAVTPVSDTAVSCRSPDSPGWPSPVGVEVRAPSCSAHNCPGLGLASPPSLPDILSPFEMQWLFHVYHVGFETVFGSWMGRFSCPFVYEWVFSATPLCLNEMKESKAGADHDRASQDRGTEKYVRISELCKKLDVSMQDCMEPEGSDDGTGDAKERLRQMEESLDGAILAFAARWLPLAVPGIDRDGGECNAIQALWRHARLDMLNVINRASYTSMLALFLFALTPIPAGISAKEEGFGLSGQACVHAALQHIQTLRARQRNLQFNGSKVSPGGRPAPPPVPPASDEAVDFIDAESTTYWAALTFDTSASLTLNCRPLLSSGLFGFHHEISWRLVRTRAEIFDEAARKWDPATTDQDLTDDRANQIVGAGAAWKLLGWKLTAIFKEALRDGHDETRVLAAYGEVVESIAYFNATFRPHLDACRKRMGVLCQETKLRWCKSPRPQYLPQTRQKTLRPPDSLMLHYHLSILMLVDIIEATDRYDLMRGLEDIKLEAESAVMDTLVFGLHNMYTVQLEPQQAPQQTTSPEASDAKDSRGGSSSSAAPAASISVPLTSIDPYPHHILAGVQLIRRAIERELASGKITDDSYASLQSTLERTLTLLPQSSKSVQAARTRMGGRKAGRADEHDTDDPYRVFGSGLSNSF